MALRDLDRQLIAKSLKLFAAQTEHQTAHFSRIIPWLSVARACTLVPRASLQALQKIRALVQSNDFDATKAAQCFNILRAELLPKENNLFAKVVRCAQPATTGPACTNEAKETGCDSCAGRQYFAKTDGETVWMADECFGSRNRLGGAEMLAVGHVVVASLTEFIICHEFAHMMQAHGNYFDTAMKLYAEARVLIPPELVKSGRVLVNDDDALDFAANSFAYESTRSDREARKAC